MLHIALIAHVVLGLLAVGASYTAAMVLLKRTVPIGWLRWSSMTAFVSYMLSWMSGGYYYVLYYGGSVKPVIKGGEYPWAHSIVMESKEHVFLFLPALTFVIVLAAFLWQKELAENSSFRKAMAALAVLTFIIGVSIALAGIIISGAAR